MRSSDRFLNPSEAARRLGVSAKALRLYEQRGLVAPRRTAAGWRAYGPDEMARAGQVVALRALGLSLAQIAQVLGGDAQALEPALAAHQAALERQGRQLAGLVEKVCELRAGLARGRTPDAEDLARLLAPSARPSVAFDLPWPWGGEPFALRDIPPLTYITGPLGSGKTRLALRLVEALPDATFLGLDRTADGGAAVRAGLTADPALAARVERARAWLVEDGATPSDDLLALLAALEVETVAALVIDTPEQGLNQASQEALAARLRRRGPDARPVFLLTRSSAILDLAALGIGETILYCPANHAPPIRVAPCPGAPGYEAVASCLASPEVRARTAGMIAVMSRAG
ncbi:MerR family transcriptional regulator [Caulobacter sp. UNC279MFTsu5.1]|uniref:MerR family transcriptional regulator n=1 Tax=Caulobacter sp. UNC279MFTsu5.1 TaxID=1502775 RepID=UPI0008E3FC5A|nr:MerR family transcriptional regulator [Caulobacter sp. UNC279MFTsu5.1]SFK69558.1 DNA-binding transcriptional regulator, MerR family [Caulobacter sp. UNC279MFTsu5.1]